MQNIDTFLTLDVYDYDLSPSTIKAIALDSNTRSVTAYITQNGQPYDVGQSNVTLTVIRPDGVGAQVTGEAFEYEASVEDTTVTRHGAYAELSPATLAKKGTLRAQFMFTSGNQVLRTEIFTISCGEALDASTDTWAGEYQGYNLDELVQNVNELSAKVDAMKDDVLDLKEGLTSIGVGGKLLDADVKNALINILSHVAYIDGDGQTYINALIDAWTVKATLTGITATFTQGSTKITDRDSLDVLKPLLKVEGTYLVSSTTFKEEITEYALSGTLSVGQSTITVTVGNFTTTFIVTVTEWSEYDFYTKIIATGAEYIATDFTESALDGCSYEYKAAPAINNVAGSGHIFSAKNTFVAYPQTHSSSYNRRISTRKNYGSEKAYGTADNPAWNDGVDMVVQAFVGNDNSVLLDGTTIISRVPVGSAIESDQNYAVFGYGGNVNASNYRFHGALYYLKIFDSNGTLIHHFIPAKSNITNIAGLYDIITETFYTSATTTDFVVEQ